MGKLFLKEFVIERSPRGTTAGDPGRSAFQAGLRQSGEWQWCHEGRTPALCCYLACSLPFSKNSASASTPKGYYTNVSWAGRSYTKGSCAGSDAEGLHAISNIADGKMPLMPYLSKYPVEVSSGIPSPQRVMCMFF